MQEIFPYEKLDRKILRKGKEEAICEYGSDPRERTVEQLLNFGVINIDKPVGPTSHMVSAYLKSILHIEKCGHSGTLDPAVSGVLPIALGKSTKGIQALLSAGKEYIAIIHFHSDISEEKVMQVFNEFTGKINQMPPVKSAVKRQLRQRSVYYITFMEKNGRDVLFKAGTQAGTYIRKLCFDMGKSLNTGANMKELRRTRVAEFREDTLATLQDVKDAYQLWKEKGNDRFLKKIILPIEYITKHVAKIWIYDSAIPSLSHGRDLAVPGIYELERCVKKGEPAAVMTLKGELVCFGEAMMDSEEIMSVSKGIAVLTHKVFISEI